MSKSSWRCFCCGCETCCCRWGTLGLPPPPSCRVLQTRAHLSTPYRSGLRPQRGAGTLMSPQTFADLVRVWATPLQRTAPPRQKKNSFLVANMGDLKALRSCSKLHDDQILFPCMGGSHRRLADYAAVEPGRYGSMDALNLSWKQWDIRSKSWVHTSAQEYLATGEPFYFDEG
jgi:hypothetical protein